MLEINSNAGPDVFSKALRVTAHSQIVVSKQELYPGKILFIGSGKRKTEPMHCFREFSLPVSLRKSLVDKENPKIACWIMDVFGNFREPLRLFFCTKGTKGNSYDGCDGYNQDFDFWFVVLCSFSGPSRRGDFRRGGSELFVRSVRGGTLQAAWIGAPPPSFCHIAPMD